MVPPIITIINYTYIQDKNPYPIYHIQIQTEYSVYTIYKRHKQFLNLHSKLIKHELEAKMKYPRVLIEGKWPRFELVNAMFMNDSVNRIIKRIGDTLTTFSQQLIKIYLKLKGFHSEEPYVQLIDSFFGFSNHRTIENYCAIKIQKIAKIYLQKCITKKMNRLKNHEKGYNKCLIDLPVNLMMEILSYCDHNEITRFSLINQYCRNVALDQYLWTNVKLYGSNYSKCMLRDQDIQNLLRRYKNIEKLSIGLCDELIHNCSYFISQYANPFKLKELEIYGCIGMNDYALEQLVLEKCLSQNVDNNDFVMEDFSNPKQYIINLKEYDPKPGGITNQLIIHPEHIAITNITNLNNNEISPLSSIFNSPLEKLSELYNGGDSENSDKELYRYNENNNENNNPDLIILLNHHDHDKIKGGAKGLRKLSIIECENLTDKGMKWLKKLPSLECLSLSGCINIGDKGIRKILKNCVNLKELDLSGTGITSKTVMYMITNHITLTRINVQNCKFLDENYFPILNKCATQILFGNDYFRFTLTPIKKTLPNLSNRIFKTRKSLSIRKLYDFLKDRLLELDPRLRKEDELATVEIFQRHLNSSKRAIMVKDLLANDMSSKEGNMEPLRLFYTIDHFCYARIELTPFEKFKKNLKNIKQPQCFVDKAKVLFCMNLTCNKKFGFFCQKYYCYRCGKCYCKKCTRYSLPLPELSYDEPTRICILCKEYC